MRVKDEARVGFEPAIRVLQTHALPLGYLATCKQDITEVIS